MAFRIKLHKEKIVNSYKEINIISNENIVVDMNNIKNVYVKSIGIKGIDEDGIPNEIATPLAEKIFDEILDNKLITFLYDVFEYKVENELNQKSIDYIINQHEWLISFNYKENNVIKPLFIEIIERTCD